MSNVEPKQAQALIQRFQSCDAAAVKFRTKADTEIHVSYCSKNKRTVEVSISQM